MYRPRRWNLADFQSEEAQDLARQLRTSAVLAQLLINRGLTDPSECQAFLRPSLKSLHDPATIPNLTRAAGRIATAIRGGEKIVIYGDYDVDGITATSILWHAIRLLGGNVDYYIPHRIEEGYGLNGEAVAEICDGGAKLIVTVDCGVTAIEPASIARQRQVDLIITDHHEWREEATERRSDEATKGEGDASMGRCDDPNMGEASSPLPSVASSLRRFVASIPLLPGCHTVVHPRLTLDGATPYPNPHLCGAGVAFKLAWGVGQAVNGAAKVNDEFRQFLVEATGLAALGTIADVVPLVGENRILAAFGLSGLKASKLAGIQALIESAGLTGKALDSYHVGFLLAPRLNAAGRMGHAREAVEMLTRADESTALRIAVQLETQNKQRRAIEQQICDEAIQQVIDQKLDTDDCRAIVLAGEGWHPGVIGIVASRLVERFHRPTVLIAINEGIGSGSGRSIAGFHLAQALAGCADLLEAHGGHEMAAGLKIRAENFPAFRHRFTEHARQVLCPEQLVPELQLDALAELQHLTETFTRDLKRLGPFGHGNRKPVLVCKNLELAAPLKRVGAKGDHVQLFLKQGTKRMKAIAFGYGANADLCAALRPGVKLDIAFEPTLNEFNGYVSVEMQVKDLQIATA